MKQIIVGAALLISTAFSQPMTTFSNTVLNTANGATSTSSYAVDYLTVDASHMYPFVFPVDKCVATSLIDTDTKYYMYNCSGTGNTSVLYKQSYSSSACSGDPLTSEMWRSNFTVGGLINSFYCDGNANNDNVFTLNTTGCGSNTKEIMSVADICFFNSVYNDTVTEAYNWLCPQSGAYISFQVFSITGQRSCSGTADSDLDISNTTCTTITALNSLSAKITVDSCSVSTPSPSSIISPTPNPSSSSSSPSPSSSSSSTPTPISFSSSSNGIILTVGIMWFIASFFAIILV